MVYANAMNKTKSIHVESFLEDIAGWFESKDLVEKNNYKDLSAKIKPVKMVVAGLQKAKQQKAAQPSEAAKKVENTEKVGKTKGLPVAKKKESVKVAQPQNKIESPDIKQKLQLTPRYSVQVSNELFHNGNVEAWKNIIESYHNAHPEVKVLIFHDGEKINNINTLFKWGKVKNGDVILFQVVGNNFRNISKLQRYLYEGASGRYGQFLKKDISVALTLF